MNKMISKARAICMAIAIAAVAISCSSDDDKPSSHFTIDGTQTEIKTVGVFVDESPNTNAGVTYHRHELALLSNGLTINGSAVSGSGSAILLSINGQCIPEQFC